MGIVGALVAIPAAAALRLLLHEVTFRRLDRSSPGNGDRTRPPRLAVVVTPVAGFPPPHGSGRPSRYPRAGRQTPPFRAGGLFGCYSLAESRWRRL